MPMRSWNSALPRATAARTSTGNTTFLTRLAWARTRPGARPTLSEKQAKTSSPAKATKANSPWPSVEVPQRTRKITLNTKVKTASIANGVASDHRRPSAEPR